MNILCLGLTDNEKNKIYEYIHSYVELYRNKRIIKDRPPAKDENDLVIIDLYECLKINKIKNCIITQAGKDKYNTYTKKDIEKYLVSYPKINETLERNFSRPIIPKFIIQRIT